MKYNIFFYFNSSFMTFSSRIRLFPDRIRILADPDLDSEKNADPDPGNKTRIRNTGWYKIKKNIRYVQKLLL